MKLVVVCSLIASTIAWAEQIEWRPTVTPSKRFECIPIILEPSRVRKRRRDRDPTNDTIRSLVVAVPDAVLTRLGLLSFVRKSELRTFINYRAQTLMKKILGG